MIAFREDRHERISEEQERIRDSGCAGAADRMHVWVDATSTADYCYRYSCEKCERQYRTTAAFGPKIW
jgi:hypothetical protein